MDDCSPRCRSMCISHLHVKSTAPTRLRVGCDFRLDLLAQTPLQQCDKLFADIVHPFNTSYQIIEPERSLVCSVDVSCHVCEEQ